MEPKLAYRALRKISDWTVYGFYSEVSVDGQNNVPKTGPVIIASTHHNEIIDIATLAVTIPYRRHLSFWAKSTMFTNPITRLIMESSGAIPVKRNPNSEITSTVHHNTDSNGRSSPHSNLFRDTSAALGANQVVGVFPEGTSYTRHSILQIMPGAAWTAVEFARSLHEGGFAKDGKTGLKIIPVGIVYSDKSRYRSRISVRYGEPIEIDSYTEELFQSGVHFDTSSRSVVKKIMSRVEEQMMSMTVNASDWDTLCAAQTAREILWSDERRLPLEDLASISQGLVNLLTISANHESPGGSLVESARTALMRYHALLHYTNIKHSILTSLLPSISFLGDNPFGDGALPASTIIRPLISLLSGLPLAVIQLVTFVPPLLFYIPGYLSGRLAARLLAAKDETESQAQFKAVGGGLGIGAFIGLVLGLARKVKKWQPDSFGSNLNGILGSIGALYAGVVVLVRWHNHLVDRNYRQLRRLLTFNKLFLAVFLKPRIGDALESYSKPPSPPANIFVRRKTIADINPESAPRLPLKRIAPWRLIRQLLLARQAAHAALRELLESTENRPGIEYLLKKGGYMEQ